MARDHERTNLDIWGDDDWLDLTPPAQHLYFVLKTDPDLSYCGSSAWHPGRIAARARGWTSDRVEQAAAELSASAGLFLVVDTATEEYLLRSWIKHDGLWRIPNMAVSMANARAALASRTLRGVVVHEVKKLAKHHPEIASWQRDAVAKMLSQRDVDPAELSPLTPGLTPGLTPRATPEPTPPVTPGLTLNGGVGVNPPPNPPATPSPAPSPLAPSPLGGYVTGEPHQANPTEPPTPFCPRHPHGTDKACHACGQARERRDIWDTQHTRAQAQRRHDFWAEVRPAECCDPNGMTDDGHRLTRCPNHDWSQLDD